MPIFVKGHIRKGHPVASYTRNTQYKKGKSVTGRIEHALHKISGQLGFANMQGNVLRSRTLNKRMIKVRAYMIGRGL